VAGLSLRELARDVGMQAPSLYSYFPSKHAIYDAMFAQGNAELLARSTAVKETADARADLVEGARMFITFVTEDPARAQLLFQHSIPGFVPSDESYAVAVKALGIVGERLHRAGVTSPRHLDLWTALLTGLASQQLTNDPGGDRWSRLAEEAVDMFLEHVDAPKRPRRKSR
jgi:AcrR family transcriptional regulator